MDKIVIMLKALRLAALTSAIVMAGCGGGGGGAEPDPTQTTTKAAYNYSALDGTYTCSSSGVDVPLQAKFEVGQLEINWGYLGSVVYKDKVGFLDGMPYYSRNTPLTSNAETIFFFNGRLTIVAGPAADVPSLLAQRPKSIADCSRTGLTTPSQPNTGNSLQSLYGTIHLKYKFNGDTKEYNDSAILSAGNLSSDGKILSGNIQDSTSTIACSILTSGDYGYFCVIFWPDSTKELFVFNLSSNKVTGGNYEFCAPQTTIETCTNGLLTSPDGVVLPTSGVLEAGTKFALNAGGDQRDAQLFKQIYAGTLPIGNAAPTVVYAEEKFIQELLTRLTPPLTPAFGK